MKIGKAGKKGQIVIPVSLRKRYNTGEETRISILDGNGVILLKSLNDDPVAEAKGFLRGDSSLLEALRREREVDIEWL